MIMVTMIMIIMIMMLIFIIVFIIFIIFLRCSSVGPLVTGLNYQVSFRMYILNENSGFNVN